MLNIKKPLSPHLQVYRLPLTAILSISHRLAGIILGFSYILFVLFIIMPVFEVNPYVYIDNIYSKVAMYSVVFALFYHILNGIRHIIWDFGYGFKKNNPILSSYLVILLSLGLTFFYIFYYFL